MTWYSRTWSACSWRGCDREILKNRALDHGWYAKPEGGWLCPWHSPERDVTDDVKARAAGERRDDE